MAVATPAVLGLCLALEAALGGPGVAASAAAAERRPGDGVVFVALQRFTLAWTHSIEKTRWEEDYAVRLRDGRPALALLRARVRGSGAGMEPPAGAVWRDGWYEFVPAAAGGRSDGDAPLRLTRSPYTADYEVCTDGRCGPLGDWLRSDGGVTRMWACRSTDERR